MHVKWNEDRPTFWANPDELSHCRWLREPLCTTKANFCQSIEVHLFLGADLWWSEILLRDRNEISTCPSPPDLSWPFGRGMAKRRNWEELLKNWHQQQQSRLIPSSSSSVPLSFFWRTKRHKQISPRDRVHYVKHSSRDMRPQKSSPNNYPSAFDENSVHKGGKTQLKMSTMLWWWPIRAAKRWFQ